MRNPDHAMPASLRVVATALLTAAMVTACGHRDRVSSRGSDSVSLVAGLATPAISTKLLDTLSWNQVQPTLVDLARNSLRMDRVYAVASASSNAPARYLCGLIALTRENPSGALEFFESIPVATIPPSHLYAPYRLVRTLRPDTPNPYREPLVANATNHLVNPLVEARVSAMEGFFTGALAAYLRSDPGDWTDLDTALLSLMRNHAGMTRDVESTVGAALRGGRIPAVTATNLDQRFSVSTATDTGMVRRLQDGLSRNPDLQDIVRKAATRQLRDQQDFLAGKYGELLGRYRAADPQQQSDKMTIMLTLCAARVKDRAEFDRWSTEIRRRVPDPSVTLWLTTLKQDIK